MIQSSDQACGFSVHPFIQFQRIITPPVDWKYSTYTEIIIWSPVDTLLMQVETHIDID